MNCPLESPIPPEATSRRQPDVLLHDDPHLWQRLCEYADNELTWCPDDVHAPRYVDSDALLLETRGVTSHKGITHVTVAPSPKQLAFWKSQTVHKHTIAAKLRTAGLLEDALKLEDCHSRYVVAICDDCRQVQRFPNRCDLFFCPECQPHLARERQKQVKWWTALIAQPKHVVLTLTNLPTLEPAHVDELRASFSRLRRRKIARNWEGGFYSIEVTNEGRGWHLHLHALINARWIDAAALSEAWQASTRGFGRIVKVKDCRNDSYLAEVTKYTVKGPQLAAWNPNNIATFISAFRRKRTFGVFGSLFAQRTRFAEFIATLKTARPRCPCGSCNVRYMDEHEYTLLDLVPNPTTAPRPPPEPELGLRIEPPLHHVRD